MRPDSITFHILMTLYKLYQEGTWAQRHPYSILASMPDYQRLRKKKLYDKFYYLSKQKYLRKIGEKYLLTDKAKKLIKLRDLEKILKDKSKKWDKKWRIVIFDIPEILRVKRNLLRELLGRLNFIKIQKSVWLSPYDLLGEVDELIREEHLSKFVLLIETKKISNYQRFEQEFFRGKT